MTMTSLTILAVAVPLAFASGIEPEGPSAALDNSGAVTAPVLYDGQMLVVVTDEGVAAIVFGKEYEGENDLRGVRYRYRYLVRDGTSEEVGEGKVWTERLVTFEDGREASVMGGSQYIEAGEILLGWSSRGKGQGWIYYTPEEMSVHIANADRFTESRNPTPVRDGEPPHPPVPALDLRRFLGRKK